MAGDFGEDNFFLTAIRQGELKLIYFEKYRKLELYNVKNDIKEERDLSKQYPQKGKERAQLLTQKLKLYKTQMPLYKSNGKAVPVPDEIAKGWNE